MSATNFRSNRVLTAAVIYLVAIAAALTIATFRSRAEAKADAVEELPEIETARPPASKPFFSLSTHRTYGTTDNPRLWVDYQGVDHMDFRVYEVKDPRKFFTGLKDPHQMGKDEQEEITSSLPRRKSFLEKVRGFKRWAHAGIKGFVRTQLRRDSRSAFNQKFRKEADPVRTPLNVADYARVPLLNPDLLVTSWRETLPPLEDLYDKRMIPLGKRGPGVYLVEAVANDLRAYTVVVVTDLTMIEKTSRDGELLVYTVDRKSGEPRPGAQVEVVRDKKTIASGTTDNQGILRTRIEKPKNDEAQEEEADDEGGEADEPNSSSLLILARQSGNFAISDLGSFYFSGFEEENGEAVKGYIYTDRPVYRPAHKVSFKGIIRSIDRNGAYKPISSNTINVTIEDPNSAAIFNKELSLSPRGTFNGDVEISEEAPLGNYNIVAEAGGGRSSSSFEVAEYKKPEYKVTISAPGKFVSAGQKANFSIDARYYFGAPVANAEVKYYIYRSPYYPWWSGENDDAELTGEEPNEREEYAGYYGGGDDMVQESEGTLDARGHMNVEFQVPPPAENEMEDYSYRLEAQVTDSARRTIDGAGSFVATRGSIIADANPDRYVYRRGEVAKIKVTTGDYEGRPVSAKVQLQFVEHTWTKKEKTGNEDEYSYPQYDMHERVIASGNVETDSQGQATYDYTTSEDGNISIKTLVNEGGRQIASLGGSVLVTDRQSEWSESSYYSENRNAIKLVPDKKSYRPGETAHVLAILPSANAHLLVSTELSTVMSLQHVSSPGNSIVLDIPIVGNYAPNVFLNVSYVKNGDMYASDQRLVVPARDKMLNLEIISNKNEYKPRETASYTILARNADGSPVPGAEVSLGVVDESIYSVAPDYSGNIKSEFYGMRYNSVDTHLSINYSFTGFAGDKPMELATNKPTYQLADFKNEGAMVQPTIRKNFKDTAFWQPDVVTGADGRATVKVDLPDNLTTWRATARGVTADTKVGATKYKVVARKDVIMRLETPRFVTQGDTVTLSGIVHNYLNADKPTQISLEVNGAQLQNSANQTVTIKKQGEHRIDWQITAPNVGEIKLLARALTDTESDAVELPLTVVPRGLHQVKNESWTFSEETADKTFSLSLPPETDPAARNLRIEVAPSVAGTLFGALDYLTTYPYGCTEQTMSSFLPNVVVSQALKDVKTASIRNSDDLKKKVRRGLDRLYAFQHDDGGWGWWKDDQSDPFMTAYVVSGLTWAKQGGYDVEEDRITNGRQKLKQMLDLGTTEAGTAIDLETRAFMLYALEETGGSESHHVEKIFGERSNLQPYGRALLALTLKQRKDDKRAREVAAEIERTATSDSFYTSWDSRRKPMLDFAEQNDTEATALSLKALARIKPDSQLLSRVARWLVSNRRNSHYWSSTKDTAFAIFGLIDYLKVSKELSPDYDVEVYLNGENVLTEHISSAGASQTFSINRKATEVPGTNDIRIVKRGKGLIYFSTSLDYYTGEEDVAARGSSNLNVTREYLRLRVIEDGHKLKWAADPLRGEIHSGDVLVVRLKLNGAKARHLMIEDPIPAGAEQVESVGNLNLNYTEGNWSDWYSSREFRDNRTVFFMDYFDGDATLQYAMRVQVPGQFRVAPARAELMYRPTTQSNTASAKMGFLERK